MVAISEVTGNIEKALSGFSDEEECSCVEEISTTH